MGIQQGCLAPLVCRKSRPDSCRRPPSNHDRAAFWAFHKTARISLFVIPLRCWFGAALVAYRMLGFLGWIGLPTYLPVIRLGFLARFAVALRLIWTILDLLAWGSMRASRSAGGRGHWRPRSWALDYRFIPCTTPRRRLFGLGWFTAPWLLLSSVLDIWVSRLLRLGCLTPYPQFSETTDPLRVRSEVRMGIGWETDE